MKAHIAPLEGKYYGTEVVYIDENGHGHTIVVWDTTGYTPSKRELNGKTEKEWREWGDFSHAESERSLQIAECIVDALKKFNPLVKGGKK